jgi:hypothetical protein
MIKGQNTCNSVKADAVSQKAKIAWRSKREGMIAAGSKTKICLC